MRAGFWVVDGIRVEYSPCVVPDTLWRIGTALFAFNRESAANVIDWQNEVNRLWPNGVKRG